MRFELSRLTKIAGRYWPAGSIVDLAELLADEGQRRAVARDIEAAECGRPLAAQPAGREERQVSNPAPADPDPAPGSSSDGEGSSKRAKRAKG